MKPHMWLQALAGIVLLVVLFVLFRFAMGLRWAKIVREQARVAEESRGRRVVAELPTADGLLLLLEDEATFRWGDCVVEKDAVVGARLLLNGGVVGEHAPAGAKLPPAPVAEDGEGRERWEVVVYRDDGGTAAIPCGWLREGVSREIAKRAFAAIRDASERASPQVMPARGPRPHERSA
jgi:hypothetical protein